MEADPEITAALVHSATEIICIPGDPGPAAEKLARTACDYLQRMFDKHMPEGDDDE
jgi:hypothetical protein